MGKSSAPRSIEDFPSDQWERLWFALADRPWQSLAIVSAQPDLATVMAAQGLCASATLYIEAQVTMIDACRVHAGEVQGIEDAIANELWGGRRVIVALGHPLNHAPSIPLARFTDASILCVQLHRARLESARQTVQAIGEQRFIGSLTMEG